MISNWRSLASLNPTWIIILLYLHLSFFSWFKLPSMSPTLAPRIHLTIVPGVGFTYRKTESPITRVGFSVGVSPIGEKRLATGSGQWWTTGLCFGLRFLRTVTQPPWLPGCSGAAGEQLTPAKLGRAAQANCCWLVAGATMLSVVRRRVSSLLSLTSRSINKRHFLHAWLSLKETEE